MKKAEIIKNGNLNLEQINSGKPAPDNIILPPALFDKVIKYIENAEEVIEYEQGSGRSVKRLIELGNMPEIYIELIALKK